MMGVREVPMKTAGGEEGAAESRVGRRSMAADDPRKKISVVTCVGNNDPYGQEDPYTKDRDGPVLALLQVLADRGYEIGQVVLCATAEHDRTVALEDGTEGTYRQAGTEGNAGETRDEIRDRWSGASAEVVTLRVNPTDIGEVIERLQGALGEVPLTGDEVHVNTSSGTPTMSAALAFLAHSGFLRADKVWRVVNRAAIQAAMGPAGSAPARIAEVDLSFLSERGRLERALRSLRAMAFDHAKEAFDALSGESLLSGRRDRARVAVDLADAYSRWDRADFEGASEAFQRFQEKWRWQLGCSDLIDRQIQTVAKLAQTRCEDEEVLLDIYSGVLRRCKAGNHMNAATKARRLYEGILNHLICRAGLDPRALTNQQLQEKLPGVADAARNLLLASDDRAAARLSDRTGYRIGTLRLRQELIQLLTDRRILQGFSGDALNQLVSLYRRFEAVRNQCYDEHGLRGVTPEQGNQVVDAATEMVKLALPGRPLDELPFAPGSIQNVADCLGSVL
jgi:hypothetical protein